METQKRLQTLLPANGDRKSKDLRNRVMKFIGSTPEDFRLEHLNLAQHRDYLLAEGYSPSSVKNHLSSIRGWIRQLLKNGELQSYLLQDMDADLSEDKKKQQLDYLVGQVRYAISPETAPMKVQPQSALNLNLMDDDINKLIDTLRFDKLSSLRDATVIMVMIATGIREGEVSALQVDDLHHMIGEKRALHVPAGRGCVERLVPYLDDAAWALDVVETWLSAAKIESGPVFRGLYKTGNLLREGGLSVSAVERLLANYPIIINGKPTTIAPLSLRHAYASHLFRSGSADFNVLKRYLGVKTNSTVLDYLGNAVQPSYTPYSSYEFDLDRLNRWK